MPQLESEDVPMHDAEHHLSPPPKKTEEDHTMDDGTVADGTTPVINSSPQTRAVIQQPLATSASPAKPVGDERETVRLEKPTSNPPTTEDHHTSKSVIQNPPHQSNQVLPSVEGNDFDVPRDSSQKIEVPTEVQALEADRLEKDSLRLKKVLGEVSHKAAQNVLRENWRTFLFDPPDESHVAFILRAGLKNSTPGILTRVIKDDNVFKQSFVEAASQKPALRRKVWDTITFEEICRDLPRDMLNSLVAAMIGTVDVRQLVYWLAKANRLGFEEDDIRAGGNEIYVPNMGVPPLPKMQQPYQNTHPQQNQPPPYNHRFVPPPKISQHQNHQVSQGSSRIAHPQPRSSQAQHLNLPRLPSMRDPGGPLPDNSQDPKKPAPPPAAQDTDPLLAEQNRQRSLADERTVASPKGPLICADCNHQFQNDAGYQYHLTKKPCLKPPPPEGYKAICVNCRQGFTTKQGNDYHQMKRVCLGEGDSFPTTAPAPPPGYMAAPTIQNDGLPRPSSRFTSGAILPPQSQWISQQPQRPPTPPQHHPSNRPASFTPANTITQQPRKSSLEVSRQSPRAKKTPSIPQTTFANSSTAPTTRKQAPRAPEDIRVEPSQLPPERLRDLNRDLDELDRKYEQGLADIPSDWDEAKKELKRQSLKNANASRKSQVRKSYGVTLRLREKDKLARDSLRLSVNGSSSPPGSSNSSPAPPSYTIPRPRFDAFKATSNSSPLAGVSKTSGFSPVNATSIIPPGMADRPNSNQSQNNGYTPYRPPPSNHSPMSIAAISGVGDSRSNTSDPSEPKARHLSDIEILNPFQPRSNATSGSSTPSTTSNPGLKRRHEGLEHERRPGSGQGGYTGSIPAKSVKPSSQSTHNGQIHDDMDELHSSGLSMVEVAREDASRKFAGGEKTRRHFSRAEVKDSDGGNGKTNRNAIKHVINLDDDDSDDDSDVESIPASGPRPLSSGRGGGARKEE